MIRALLSLICSDLIYPRLLLVTGADLRLIQSGPAPLPDPSLFWHPTTAVVITLITKLFQPPPQNPFWLAPPASPSIVILITMSSGGGSEHQLNFWLIRTGDTFPWIIIICVGQKALLRLYELPVFLYVKQWQHFSSDWNQHNFHTFRNALIFIVIFTDVIRINRDKLGSWVHGLTIGVFALPPNPRESNPFRPSSLFISPPRQSSSCSKFSS